MGYHLDGGQVRPQVDKTAQVLQMDSSDRGFGAVLTQQVHGVDRPILYISRKLSEREARYSTVEKECLAIRWRGRGPAVLPAWMLLHPSVQITPPSSGSTA